MRAWMISCGVVLGVVFVLATISPSRGDSEASEEAASTDDPAEPITKAASMPFKGSESPMRDPFAPYDVGDSNGVWKYEDLTADEKAVADQGLDQDQSKIQDGYAAAAKDIAARAKSDAAAIQLGVENLAEVGVVGNEEGVAP